MSEIDAGAVRRLVTGRKNDGRTVYDPQAKADVARMALQCGINANLRAVGADDEVSHAPGLLRAGLSALKFKPDAVSAHR
jgi:transposase